MPKAPPDLRSLARSHTETAVRVLAGIMREKKSGASARVAASEALLNRGWGKPVQTLAGDEENPLRVTIRKMLNDDEK